MTLFLSQQLQISRRCETLRLCVTDLKRVYMHSSNIFFLKYNNMNFVIIFCNICTVASSNKLNVSQRYSIVWPSAHDPRVLAHNYNAFHCQIVNVWVMPHGSGRTSSLLFLFILRKNLAGRQVVCSELRFRAGQSVCSSRPRRISGGRYVKLSFIQVVLNSVSTILER
jgi:hypothetical protein